MTTTGRLEGKVAVITGAASGMGVTHAELFVAEGAKVVLTDLAADTGRALADRLGENAIFVTHDVTDPASWKSVVDTAVSAFGPVTVLVNNAGVSGPPQTTTEISQNDYDTTIAVDQHGTFHGMRAVIPQMIEAGGGSIVNMSSTAGMTASTGFPNIGYVASKFAVRGMTKAAAIEYAAQGIRVNSVHPGAVLTPLTEALLESAGPEFRASFEAGVPMKRLAKPEEVSYTVVFLASDESSYTTGTELVIDGGLTAE